MRSLAIISPRSSLTFMPSLHLEDERDLLRYTETEEHFGVGLFGPRCEVGLVVERGPGAGHI